MAFLPGFIRQLVVKLLLIVLVFATLAGCGPKTDEPDYAFELTAEEQAWLEAHPKIVLGDSSQIPPYLIVNSNGTYSGLAVDYMNLLNQMLGNRLQLFVESEWNSITNKAIRREVDGLLGVAPGPTWDQYFLYSEPYVYAYFYAFSRAEAPLRANRSADLAGKHVGYLAGVKKVESLLRDVPELQLTGYESQNEMVNALLENEVDVLVASTDMEWWRQQNSHFVFRAVGVLDDSRYPVVMAIRNDWPVFQGIVNKALRAIPESEQASIRERWLGSLPLLEQQPLPVELTLDERAWLKAHPVIRSGADASWLPFEEIDEQGNYRGMCADFVKLIEGRLGIHFEPPPRLLWTDLLEAVKQRELDLLTCAVETPKRTSYAHFTRPHLSYPILIITNEQVGYVNGLDALGGYTVAVEKDYASYELLVSQHPEIQVYPYPNTQAALLAVARGEVFAYIGTLAAFSQAIRELGISNLKVSGETPFRFELSMGVRSDWPELVPILQKALDSITPAERNAIYQRWVGITIESRIDYTLIAWIVAICSTIILLTLYWNRRLAVEVQTRKRAEIEIRVLNQGLEECVAERTLELQEANEQLTVELVERKRAEAAEHAQRILAEALSASAAALNSTLKFDAVLDRIMEYVGQVVPHDSVAVILLDATYQTAQVAAWRNQRGEPINKEGVQFSIAQTRNLREMQETGAPVIIPDTSTYDGWIAFPSTAWIRAYVGAPISIKGEIIGFLSLESARPNAFTLRDAENLQAFVNHAATAIENARLYEKVQELALTDPLTGVFNRTFFEAELVRLEFGRDFPVSIIVADLDNMKKVNDTLGHAMGDELLKRTVQVLRIVFRAADIIARIGGDEFAILLPRTNETTVEHMLARVRAKLVEHNSLHPDLPVNLSLGASTAGQGDLLTEAFDIADRLMYADKVARKAKGG